jgi:lambda repressor-like predicted transcriptional regulator
VLVLGGVDVSVVVHPGRLRQEIARRGWSVRDLAREAKLSEATVSAALAGRPIAAGSLALIAKALSRVPASDVIDSLIFIERRGLDLT